MNEDQNNPTRLRTGGGPSGVTLVELLLVVAVIGILATGAYMAVSNVRESSRASKLEADVATINRAIDLYRAHGGILPGSAAPNDVLAQLKKAASAKYPGFSGRAIDVRLRAVMQTTGEGTCNTERAIWDGAQQKFIVTTLGSNGVRQFELDDTLGAVDYGADDTRTPPIELAASDSWVWGHQARSPLAPGAETRPTRSGEGPGIDPVAKNALKLNPPSFNYPAGEYSLLNFAALDVTLSHSNPPGVAEIWFSKNSGTSTLYTGQSISISPGDTLMAFSHSIDPDRYSDSEPDGGAYVPILHDLTISVSAPSALTWAQAGGAMANGASQEPAVATVTVDVGEIPEPYRGGSYYGIVSTLDGSNPLEAGAAATFTPGSEGVSATIPLPRTAWGNAATLPLKAAAKALNTEFFNDSAPATQEIGITPTPLAAPTIDPPSGQKAADLPVSVLVDDATLPAGYRIYYTLNGNDPGIDAEGNPTVGTLYDASTLIASGAGSGGMVTVTARVYGPEGQTRWFTPSPPASNTYNTITLAEGALVGAATLNGTFVGSLIYASPSSGGSMSNITFNSNARIMNGNLYLPGTPTIRRTNGNEWSLANDHLFATVIQGWEFNAAGVKTVQTTPRVLDENGSILPNNYSVTFNNSAILEGKVIRRHNAPAFPTIDPPPPPDSNGSTSLNNPPPGPISASQYSSVTINTSSVGDVRLLSGNYGNLTANNGTAFVLGDPDNPEVTQYYSFNSLTLNSSSDLKIVGKVVITVSGTINLNTGSVLGSSAHPEWMQLQFSSGGLNANSGSSVYGQLVAPTGSVTFNAGSVFQGSVTANSLTINSDSIVFNLPPVIEN